MAYGLADVVNQRRMIDDSEAEEDFKRLQRGKLDALLALAETLDCRRVRLLAYFGEGYHGPGADPGFPLREEPPWGAATEARVGARCGNCDNCLHPPASWDATDAARKALSCVYRFQQHSGFGFGAGHLIDVLRGKSTEKVLQRGHEKLSTFGIGAELDEAQWRGVLRQLLAAGHVRSVGEYNTLELAPSARTVLRGELPIRLRVPSEAPERSRKGARGTLRAGAARPAPPPLPLDDAASARFAALKAWRGEVAREHNLPAYIVFHDATLAEMAREQPATLPALAAIGGVGEKKLAAYGEQILRVLALHG
jgi:ATP-dependent DNA helicase RecQ